MNPQNQTKITKIEDTWLCQNCGERVIPFNKAGNATLIEGVIFLVGIGFIFLVNLFLGLILIGLSVIITVIRTSGKSKVCPVCESENIIPATSPMARKLARH